MKQFTSGLTEEEQIASEAIYQDYLNGTGDYKGNAPMSDDIILEGVFHGNVKRVQERMKEVDDLHVKATPGGKFQVSRYSDEHEQHDNDVLNELKKENAQLRQDFAELKNLIIEKLK